MRLGSELTGHLCVYSFRVDHKPYPDTYHHGDAMKEKFTIHIEDNIFDL
jgi:hypothetical protein